MKAATVLFAHGARDPRWVEPFAAVAERLRHDVPDRPVVLAFLELMRPDLGQAVALLAAEGAGRIDVVPLFLGSGGHVRHDLPALLDGLRAAYPGVDLRLHRAVGESVLVIEAMARAARQAALDE